MSARWMRALLVPAFAAGLYGCDAPQAPAPEPAPPPPAKAPALDLATLQAEAEKAALTPSPAEMQASLGKAGIVHSLSDLVQTRKIDLDTDNPDRIAVGTGVLVADVVLTVKAAPKEDLVARLQAIQHGMKQLGGGEDIDNTITDLINRIQNDAVSRDVLVRELDELSGVMIPEIKYQNGDRVVPLLQAGSWLEGANLVSTAVMNSGKFEAADTLLKQPEVVDYFLKVVMVQGGAAPDEVIAKLVATLTSLKEITSKESLTEEDIKSIHEQTDAVLALL
ncbi:MAG: hypothetical protein ABIO70_21895 [Pseudomonadota bacterium]